MERTIATKQAEIKFLLTCKYHGIYPKHINNITTKIGNNFDNKNNTTKTELTKIVNNFNYKILKLEIADSNRTCNTQLKQINTLRAEIQQILTEEDYTNFMDIQIQTKHKVKTTRENTHNKKIKQLLTPLKQQLGINLNNDWFINLTNINIPDESKWLLSMGKKFALPTHKHNINIINTIADFEHCFSFTKTEKEKEKARTFLTHQLQSYMRNHHVKHIDRFILKTYQDTLNLLKRHKDDIIITNSDKGNRTVLMYKAEYISKMNELLDDKATYKRSRTDPTEKLMRKNNTIINDLHNNKHIDTYTKLKLTCSAANAPQLYGLPKIHKPEIPMRPISASFALPAYHLSKFIGTILNNLTSTKHNIKNSTHLKEDLQTIDIEETDLLISLDVVSLFTNIPIHLATKIVLKKWDTIKNHTNIPKNNFMKILDFCLKDNNYFCFDNNTYIQNYGMPMGNPLSPTIATIVLDDLIDYTLDNLKSQNIEIKYITKYVDDFFAIIKQKDKQTILKEFNYYHNKLKFTMEEEENNKINYLDVTIHKINNSLVTNWFTKDISSGRIINYYSNHDPIQKKNTVKNFIRTVLNISDKIFIKENIIKLKTMLTKNNYPIKYIDKLIKIITNEHKTKNTPTNNNETINNIEKQVTPFATLPYLTTITNRKNLTNLINTEAVKIASKPNKTLNELFSHQKTKTNKQKQHNVVYQIKCKGNDQQQCNGIYVGQTKRQLEVRIKEHKRTVDTRTTTTALSQHAIDNKHYFDFENIKILERESKTNKRLTLESLHIKKNINKAVNKKEDSDQISSTYNILLAT